MPSLPLTLSDVFTPATQSQWLSTLLSLLGTLNVPATSWQSGGIARTIIALASYGFAQDDGVISVAAQGGFLDFSATGTVTYTTTSGTTATVAVTPDPSTLSSTQLTSWQPGWLDILADGSYNVQRQSATYAPGNVGITNTTLGAYGPFAPGTYHVSNPTTGATYSNTATLTIAAQVIAGGSITAASFATPITITTSGVHGLSTGQTVNISGVVGNTAANDTWLISVVNTTQFTLTGSVGNGAYVSGGTVNVCTVAAFQADVLGSASSTAPHTITQPVTSLVGVSVSNTAAFAGTNYESNTALAARCRLKLQSLSPNGASGAYQYFALSASTLLAAQTPAITLAGGTITRASTSAAGGVVTTTIANGGGAVAGVANVAVSNVTSHTGLFQLTVSSTTNMTTGMTVQVSGITGSGGITNANGTWTITVIDATHIDLQASTFAGTYTSGGAVEAGDLGNVDAIIQANCVPTGTTAVTQSATALPVTVAATVYVPAGQVAAYTAAVGPALTNYFASLPIGGLNTDSLSNVVPIGAIEGILYQAGVASGTTTSYVRGITGVTLNASTADVTLTATQVATVVNSVTIVGQ